MKIITVTQLNEYIKRKLDGDYVLKGVCVSGEISNYVAHASGHSYFSLKDSSCVIKCIMFKGYKTSLSFTPENGMNVLVIGEVSAYPRDGVYQLYAARMTPDGAGERWLQLEQLKKKLSEEGLFDESGKRTLPAYPERIGVITSETGAVRYDISNVLSRRYPIARIKLYPARVQGEGAAQTVIDALFRLNEDGLCDVAVIARGGGSAEDLWEFNSEALVRAVRASNVPVVSAVGHETDYTLCDLAADMRAPTPSAAAELCAPSVYDIRQRLDSFSDSIDAALKLSFLRQRRKLSLSKETLNSYYRSAIYENRSLIGKAETGIRENIIAVLTAKRIELIEMRNRIEASSPSAILAKGYAAVKNESRTVMGAAQLKTGDSITLTFADGTANARITEVNRNDI